MHRSWIRFATTGDPNGAGLPPWPAYETGTRPVMNFDTTRTLLIDPFGKERRLWDGLMSTHSERGLDSASDLACQSDLAGRRLIHLRSSAILNEPT